MALRFPKRISPTIRGLDATRARFVEVMMMALLVGAGLRSHGFELREDGYHVFPADDVQSVLDQAATNATTKTVWFQEGTYAPRAHGQAFLRLNRAHSGVRLLGLGRPVLTAANAAIADRASASFPAVVNHVIYLGDGLATNTLVEGFRLTGANHFVTNSLQRELEPDRTWRKGRFYFGDGGAIKIYHRSYPVLRDLEIIDNYASPCAGGVSIQHEGATNQWVLIENCVFRSNRAEVTGAALDLLWGSQARVVNCLFTGNVSNTGPGEGENPFTNNGAVTVFPRSRLSMERCTLTGNRNGVDEQGGLSEFSRCVFVRNTLEGSGATAQGRYELDLQQGGLVRDCVIVGRTLDPRGAIDPAKNNVGPAGFELDAALVPKGDSHRDAGYRPIKPAGPPP